MLNLAGGLAALPYVALVAAAGMLWNATIENPRIRAEARAGYVLEAEKAAAEAELAERRRQVDAALRAAEAFNVVLRQQAADLEAQSAAKEQELASYEAENQSEQAVLSS